MTCLSQIAQAGWPARLRRVLCLTALLVGAGAAQAGNLAISNVRLTGLNTASDFILVEFDVTWERSWRVSTGSATTPLNWDAVWVFVKYRVDGGVWQHATLHTSGHTAPSGLTIDTPGDGKGVFVYRSTAGTGTVALADVQLRWDYGVDGLDDGETDVEVRVLGIEMVYVPQGSFELGSGGTETDHFYEHDGTGTPDKTQSYTVASEAAITVGTTNGNLYYDDSFGDNDQLGPIPAAFPKGFAAFYVMKYEISQAQYTAFLNMLTYDQQATRTAVAPSSAAGTRALSASNRNGIEIQTPGVASTTPAVYAHDLSNNGVYDENGDGQDIACNHLSWADGAAYADWSGLRPMTELEFEKASRGTQPPVALEYAWGTTSLHATAYVLTAAGQADEWVDVGIATGNASYSTTDGSINGPLRGGIFAGSFASHSAIAPSRQESGASFYGAMELSGNLWERSVTVGRPEGRLYTGAHGNGVLTSTAPFGEADVSMWPGTNGVGAGFRGGAWGNDSTNLRVSARLGAASTNANRLSTLGFRAVRSAP